MCHRVIHASLWGLTRRSRIILILFIGLGMFAGAHTSSIQGDQSARAPAGSGREVVHLGPLIFTQIPIAAPQILGAQSQRYDAANRMPDGSRIVSFNSNAPAKGIVPLTTSFHTAGRPDLSFDGRRIVFVGKHAADESLDVWEMNVDGSELRRITHGVGNCTAAIYLPTMYTIDAEEPYRQIAFCSDAGSGVAPALYTCRMDGTGVQQITFNPYGASDPFLLSDGRLLFSSWLPPAPDGQRNTALFTINTDGTDVFVFADAHRSKAVRGMACETPSEQVVYVESVSAQEWDRGGALIAVSRKRSLHTRGVLASDSAGYYRSPFAMAGGGVLVSYRDGASSSYGLYLVDPANGIRIGQVYDDANWHDVDAVQVGARPMPPGRSSVVSDQARAGLLYGLNAYLSDAQHSSGMNDQRIHSLRVIEARAHSAVARPHSRAGTDPSTTEDEVLGILPVEPDGSFYMEVPARTPLRLQTLDADGAVLQTMCSWMWVMPGEARGCIGCHEDRELTPPNRHVLALRKPPHSIGRPPMAQTESESGAEAAARRQDKGGSQ